MKTLNKILTGIIFIVFIQFESKAQLTNGEIYDFIVGDIIQTKFNYHDPMSNKDTVFTVTILSKQYSMANDSVSYLINKKSYGTGHYMGSPFPVYYKDTILTKVYTNLNSVPSGCGILSSSCADSAWGCDPMFMGGAEFGDHMYIKKRGGRYFHWSNDATVFMSNILLYYKSGTDSCGTFMIGLGDAKKEADALSLYPNPANDYIQLNYEGPNGRVSIYDFTGRVVLKFNAVPDQIDVKELEKGIYYLRMESDRAQTLFRSFVVE